MSSWSGISGAPNCSAKNRCRLERTGIPTAMAVQMLPGERAIERRAELFGHHVTTMFAGQDQLRWSDSRLKGNSLHEATTQLPIDFEQSLSIKLLPGDRIAQCLSNATCEGAVRH